MRRLLQHIHQHKLTTRHRERLSVHGSILCSLASSEIGDHALQVAHHGILPMLAVRSPVRVAMTARIEGDHKIAGRAQRLACAFPCVPGLAASMAHRTRGPSGEPQESPEMRIPPCPGQ